MLLKSTTNRTFIRTRTIIAVLAFLFSALAGCKAPGPPNTAVTPSTEEKQTQLLQTFHTKLENSFKVEQRALLYTDLLELYHYQFQGIAELNPYFEKVFGGPTSEDVIGYLDERIQYLFPPEKELRFDRDQLALREHDDDLSGQHIYMVAQNLSTTLMFEQWVHPETIVSLEFNDDSILPSSTRIGIVQLGAAYFDAAINRQHTPLYRLATLIHEARHSDCKTPFTNEDVERVRAAKPPRNVSCGYTHVICPAMLHMSDGTAEPHPYAGWPGCDSVPWGAYAVEGVFAKSVAKSCVNCSESDRQDAMMKMADSFVRLPEIHLPMLEGKLGPPDMTSR
jgi:hypothetical protein